MKKITVSSPGKIHLIGEHSVVYGTPAILSSINKRCKVTITENKGDIKIILKNFGKEIILSEDDILRQAIRDKNHWLKNNGLINKNNYTNFSLPIFAIGEFMSGRKIKLKSIILTIESDIPIGYGMGSSASCSVAIMGALLKYFENIFDRDIINDLAYKVEQLFHGNPSGGDNTTSTYGGLIWYRKEFSGFNLMKRIPFNLSENLNKQISFIYKDPALEATVEMVNNVKKYSKKYSKKFKQILASQEELAKNLFEAIKINNRKSVKEIIFNTEKNLEKINVVSKESKKIIRLIEKNNGVAKICGAGGLKKSSGIILVFSRNLNNIIKLSKANGYINDNISFSYEGVKIENE